MRHSLLFLMAGLLWVCCKVQTPQGPMEVIPPKAHPGDMVVLRNLDPGVTGKSTEVIFEKTGAPIVGALDSVGLRVLVPNINPGKVTVRILESGREVNSAQMEVLPTIATQLLLQMDAEGKISTISRKPYSGGFEEGFSKASRQLSYDLVNREGQVLFSASITYPATERREVFEDPQGAKIRQASEKPQSIVFPLKIPNIEGATAIRLYDSGAGDLTQASERAKRKLIQEINIR
ncbi:MAG: hypothetical protein KIS77_09210 [Saprospiraceae bacterium]|nr:hypothetical protein [Saprospiraceae bacterium]